MWEGPKERDEEDTDMEEYFEQFCDKETMAFLRKAYATPPFSESQHVQVLRDAAPSFESVRESPQELKTHGKRMKLYSWHANLPLIEPQLQKKGARAGGVQVRALCRQAHSSAGY